MTPSIFSDRGEAEAVEQLSVDGAQAFIDVMDKTMESPPASGDATTPGNSVDVKRPPTVTRQLSREVSRVQDAHREEGGEFEAVVQHSADDAQVSTDVTDEPLESPLASGDATTPGNSVYVKRSQVLVGQLSKNGSRELSVQDTHRDRGGEVPTRDVQASLPLFPLPPPTIGGNERLSRRRTLAVGGRTTDESSPGSRLSVGCMYSMFSRFAELKSIDR